MKAFAGTWRLVRLALRRDRIKLPISILAIVGVMASSVSAIGDVYKTPDDRIAYAVTTAGSVIAKAFGGLINGPSLGSIMMVETFLFIGVLIAFMSTLAIVRHTRANEETGAAELISSGIVGRHASLSAAFITVIGANVLTGGLITLMLQQNSQLAGSNAVLMGASLAAVGIAFAAVAALAVQLSESGRGANSLAAASIGVAFLVRAIGDSLGSVSANGLSASSNWLSWLSPFAWGFQVHPFTEENLAPLGLLFGFALITIGVAFYLSTQRDVGLGIFPARKGPKAATKNLLSVRGLTWRLQKGTLYGWTITFIILGVLYGGMVNEFKSLFENNEAAQEYLFSSGGSGDLNDVFFGAMLAFSGIVAAGYCVQTLLRLRSEESTGHVEYILGGAVGKKQWAISHIVLALLGVTFLMFIMGIAGGITYVLIGGVPASEIIRLGLAALVQLPAVFAIASFVILIFGLLPRLATALSWLAFIGSFLIYQLGVLLELPQWVINISPFTHIPSVPAESLTVTPLLVLSTVSAALIVLGLAIFRRRDLTIS
jgi:ABC-2 type transport system permease protein